jgi:hypothetical protein
MCLSLLTCFFTLGIWFLEINVWSIQYIAHVHMCLSLGCSSMYAISFSKRSIYTNSHSVSMSFFYLRICLHISSKIHTYKYTCVCVLQGAICIFFKAEMYMSISQKKTDQAHQLTRLYLNVAHSVPHPHKWSTQRKPTNLILEQLFS